jgi:hypothetical protein
LPLVLLYSFGYKLDAAKLRFTRTGIIYIKTVPDAAAVSLNGRHLKGLTPMGIEGLMPEFIKDSLMPLGKKIRKAFNILDSHVTWAVWASIIALIGPLSVALSTELFRGRVIGFNLPRITGVLFNLTNITLLLWVILSWSLLPPRPRGLKLSVRIKLFTQWLLVPIAIIFVGSTPALDAQTRLALGNTWGLLTPRKKEAGVKKALGFRES